MNVKKIPKWAWVVAIAGGLLIGFLVLSKPGADEEEPEEEGGDELMSEGDEAGGSVVAPLDEDLLGALGLTPSNESPSFSDFFFGDSSSDSGGGESQSALDARLERAAKVDPGKTNPGYDSGSGGGGSSGGGTSPVYVPPPSTAPPRSGGKVGAE